MRLIFLRKTDTANHQSFQITLKNVSIFFFTAILIFNFILSLTALYPQEISEYEKRRENISKEIEILQKKIKEEEKRESSYLGTISKLSLKKRLIHNEISLFNMQMKKARRELKTTQNNIDSLKIKLEESKDSFEAILVSLYKFGHLSFFDFMLQVKDVGSLITGTKHLTILAKYQEKIIADHLQNFKDLKKAEMNLESKKKEISELLKKASKKNQELEREKQKYKSLINQIQKNKKIHLQTLKELQERNEQLKILIKKLEKKPLKISIIPLYEKKGRLEWPIRGKIVSRFGKQRHPRFNTVTINNGIEIAPKSDRTVRSIHSGSVVFADYFPGYGNLLIIDHGLSYVSLYGHCSKFLRKMGDIVQAGDSIAEVGDISSLKGITLCFEIRFKRDALNPLKWLKK